MNLPDPTDPAWTQHLSDAFARFIATCPQPNPIVPDDELIPGRDDLEECHGN